MSAKLYGAVFVITAWGFWGFHMGHGIKKDIAALREWIGLLSFMTAELKNRVTPLPSLFIKAAERSNVFSQLFSQAGEGMARQQTTEASACMRIAIKNCGGISKQLKPFLLRFSQDLGEFDLDSQLSSLYALQAECEGVLRSWEASRDQRIRTYQTIGLCVGTVLTILFY